jgi:hypothetical protein
MKRLRLSLQLVVAILAISITLAAKGGVIKNTVINNSQDCYYAPITATVGNCVNPGLVMNTDACTEPPLAYCCYTFSVCIMDASKVLVSEIILYRGA